MKTPEEMAEAIRLKYTHLRMSGLSPDFYMLLLEEIAKNYEMLSQAQCDIDEVIAEVSVIVSERKATRVKIPIARQRFH
jgi:hypothetical protein